MNRFHYIIVVSFLLAACASNRNTEQTSKRYQRKPITEVTQEQLTTQGKVIDAIAQQSIGNIDEALTLYRQVLHDHPDEATAWYQGGKVFLMKGWVDSALHYTLEAHRLDKENIWYSLQLARIYELRNDNKELIATWEDIVSRHPSVIEYYYNLANAHIRNNDLNKAIETLDGFEKRYGVSEEVSMQKQRLWAALGKHDKAREELERLANAAPNEARYNAILAESYMQEKNYKKALTYYNRIAEHNPDDENIHISLAQCHLLMGDYRNSYIHLRQGLRNNAIDCKSRILFAGEMLRNEKFYSAYAQRIFLFLDTLMADCPPDAGHAYAYGLMLASQERYAEAAVQFRNHLAVDSSQYDAWESLMFCVSRLPDHDTELFDLAQRASKLFPLHTRPYYIQAAILHSKEGYTGAAQLLERCEHLGFSRGEMQVETYYLMADCQAHLGDTDKALAYYEKALRLSPDDPYLLNSYAYTLAEQHRDLDHAADMAKRALKSLPDDPNILDTYAWILFLQGKCPEALVQMEQAIANMKEESPTLREHYDTIKQQCR